MSAFRGGCNEFTQKPDPLDDNGHGTHVAGTIAAAQDGSGVVGVAPQADIYSIKVLDSCGSGQLSKIVQAINWVLNAKKEIGGNWIMSLSLGSDEPSLAETEAFQRAADGGILLTFAASGNNYSTNPVDGLTFPAALPTGVTVGAVDSLGQVADFTARSGPEGRRNRHGDAVDVRRRRGHDRRRSRDPGNASFRR